jgi:hypothetical protein
MKRAEEARKQGAGVCPHPVFGNPLDFVQH